MEKQAIINTPPASTYSWLKMGGARLSLPQWQGSPALTEEKEGELSRLHLSFSQGQSAELDYHLEEGKVLTLIMDFRSEGAGIGRMKTGGQLEKGAVLRLVQLDLCRDDFTLINELDFTLEEGARLELIRLFLGGEKHYDAARIELKGAESSFDSEIAYRLQGKKVLDMNYEVNHLGPCSCSDIRVKGVLAEGADKIFRGSIDFKTGCGGSEGSETEDVLLLDDTVHNRTLPVILCAEENVSGNHGATIGRLDENLLYYLESRGMDAAEVYDMMARARIEAAIRKIPDEETIRRFFPELTEEAGS